MKEPTEHQEQVALVRKLRSMGLLVLAVPNGGLRDAITAKRLKDEGVMPGTPDLIIVLDYGKVLWVEMKRRTGGRLSEAQINMQVEFKKMGHFLIVGNGAKDAFDKIKAMLEEILKRKDDRILGLTSQ